MSLEVCMFFNRESLSKSQRRSNAKDSVKPWSLPNQVDNFGTLKWRGHNSKATQYSTSGATSYLSKMSSPQIPLMKRPLWFQAALELEKLVIPEFCPWPPFLPTAQCLGQTYSFSWLCIYRTLSSLTHHLTSPHDVLIGTLNSMYLKLSLSSHLYPKPAFPPTFFLLGSAITANSLLTPDICTAFSQFPSLLLSSAQFQCNYTF